jgi:hypothetical protein
MKMVSMGEFYDNTGLVDDLPTGGQLVVTSNGQPKFVVTKSARQKMSSALAETRSVGRAGTETFDGTAFLRSLKK